MHQVYFAWCRQLDSSRRCTNEKQKQPVCSVCGVFRSDHAGNSDGHRAGQGHRSRFAAVAGHRSRFAAVAGPAPSGRGASPRARLRGHRCSEPATPQRAGRPDPEGGRAGRGRTLGGRRVPIAHIQCGARDGRGIQGQRGGARSLQAAGAAAGAAEGRRGASGFLGPARGARFDQLPRREAAREVYAVRQVREPPPPSL